MRGKRGERERERERGEGGKRERKGGPDRIIIIKFPTYYMQYRIAGKFGGN